MIGHVNRIRCFRVPEVKHIGKIQFVLFLQGADVLKCGSCPVKYAILNRLFYNRKFSVRGDFLG